MNTNIVIDKQLMDIALNVSGLKTKKSSCGSCFKAFCALRTAKAN